MAKYISIFFLILLGSYISFIALGGVYNGGDYTETAIYIFGTIIIILISFMISLLFYLIDLIKRK